MGSFISEEGQFVAALNLDAYDTSVNGTTLTYDVLTTSVFFDVCDFCK
jgi:hypothetical protein